jgi:hypothetical protein
MGIDLTRVADYSHQTNCARASQSFGNRQSTGRSIKKWKCPAARADSHFDSVSAKLAWPNVALAVRDALDKAMTERNQAIVNSAAANWPARSAQLRQNIEQLMENERKAEAGAAAAPR